MYDSAAFLALSLTGALAIVVSFTALFWAAVQDGRIETAHRLENTLERNDK